MPLECFLLNITLRGLPGKCEKKMRENADRIHPPDVPADIFPKGNHVSYNSDHPRGQFSQWSLVIHQMEPCIHIFNLNVARRSGQWVWDTALKGTQSMFSQPSAGWAMAQLPTMEVRGLKNTRTTQVGLQIWAKMGPKPQFIPSQQKIAHLEEPSHPPPPHTKKTPTQTVKCFL